MSKKLRDYFPMIQTREEILAQIRQDPGLTSTFSGWSEEQREEFLAFCTGVKGVKILYDAFFKEIMNPEYTPEHLEELLSLLLQRQIKIIDVLPNDSTRIADENSLLITDIVVQLEDGSFANIEVQKLGYFFPGERGACYAADMLLRQYRRVRGKKKKKFSYRDIKTVYLIVFYEKSPSEFHQFPDTWLHYFEQKSNTGLKLELLQKYLFIPLDIFHENHYNKAVTNKLDAWLMFFCAEEPGEVIRLIEDWPEFKPLYEAAYNICRNMEKVMGFFSEELRELDRNTVQYMMDEMQAEIDKKRAELAGIKETMDNLLEEKDTMLSDFRLKTQRLNLLTQRLLADDRIEDLRRSAGDEAYQEQLLKEYDI